MGGGGLALPPTPLIPAPIFPDSTATVTGETTTSLLRLTSTTRSCPSFSRISNGTAISSTNKSPTREVTMRSMAKRVAASAWKRVRRVSSLSVRTLAEGGQVGGIGDSRGRCR